MNSPIFLKTGEFARLCRTTKETLLHYDREGVFKPKFVSSNGYRRYGMDQYFDFDLITVLRSTGSSLEDIRNYRKASAPRACLNLLQERLEVLKEEQLRLARREAMLKKLIALTEETLAAEYDRLLFEERKPERVSLFPTIPEKMKDDAGMVECYASCLEHDLERGNTVDPPLGTIVPEKDAKRGEFRLCHFFTRAEADEKENVREIPGGRYAVFFHDGDISSQAEAFGRMARAIAREGLRMIGDVYVYDQMSYLLTAPVGREYTAKHTVRVE